MKSCLHQELLLPGSAGARCVAGADPALFLLSVPAHEALTLTTTHPTGK